MSLRELDTAGPPSRALVADVERAATVKAACAAVVEHLARRPGLMPSLYLMRGGRLRCQAVKGYWQVFDGMRPHAGVIGTTFATGIPAVIRSTSTSADYLEAVPTVRSEVCVPIRLENRVIGALNVESEQELGEGLLSVLERCAECVARRIAEVGGLPAETRPERLARHAAELTGLVETEAILERAMDAACDIADMESATVALVSAGTPRLASARGPHAPALRGLAPEQVAMVAEWIRASSSVYTIGEPDGRGFSGHEALRGAGAGALVALPLAAEKGFLLLVDSAPISLETEDIELLELLAAQTSSALATAAAVGELQERAASDPLTGLGHHASFHASLEEACTRRERRGRLALLIVDLDGFKQINDTDGHQAGDRVLRDAATALQGALRAGDLLCRIGGDEFAALLTTGNRDEAQAAADRLRRAVGEHTRATASIGLALHTPPEEPTGFFARADAALYGAKRAGGNRATVG